MGLQTVITINHDMLPSGVDEEARWAAAIVAAIKQRRNIYGADIQEGDDIGLGLRWIATNHHTEPLRLEFDGRSGGRVT